LLTPYFGFCSPQAPAVILRPRDPGFKQSINCRNGFQVQEVYDVRHGTLVSESIAASEDVSLEPFLSFELPLYHSTKADCNRVVSEDLPRLMSFSFDV